MTGNKCFVPGCKTGYVSDIKKRDAEGKRRLSLFSAPVEEDKLQKWSKAISRSDRELSIKDKVCELHFSPKDICRHFIHHMPDGTTVLIPKEKINLTKEAVPSIFPNLPSNLTKKNKKTKPPLERIPLSKSTKKRKLPLKRMQLPKINKRRKHSLERMRLFKKIKVEDIQIEEVFTVDEAVSPFTFDDLLKNIAEVHKPNKFWAVSSHEDFILCVKWDLKFSPERQIIIDANLDVKLMYYGTETSFISNTLVESVESLSQIILDVDKCEICPGAKNGNKNCSVVMEREWGYGRPKKWCFRCKANISRTKRALICPRKSKRW